MSIISNMFNNKYLTTTVGVVSLGTAVYASYFLTKKFLSSRAGSGSTSTESTTAASSATQSPQEAFREIIENVKKMPVIDEEEESSSISSGDSASSLSASIICSACSCSGSGTAVTSASVATSTRDDDNEEEGRKMFVSSDRDIIPINLSKLFFDEKVAKFLNQNEQFRNFPEQLNACLTTIPESSDLSLVKYENTNVNIPVIVKQLDDSYIIIRGRHRVAKIINSYDWTEKDHDPVIYAMQGELLL